MTKMHALKIRAARALELIRRKADDDHGAHDPHRPRYQRQGGSGPRGPGPLRSVAPRRVEPRAHERDQQGEIARERNVLAERRPHRQIENCGIPRAGQRVPARRLTEREQTHGRAAEEHRVDQ